MSDAWIESLLPGALKRLTTCRNCPAGANTDKGLNLAGKQAVCRVLDGLISVLFPGCHGAGPVADSSLDRDLRHLLLETCVVLKGQLRRALEYQCEVDKCVDCHDCDDRAEAAVQRLVRDLPGLQQCLQEDILAAYEGDPAARSTMEVVMSYPGVYAIIAHRIAHVLYDERIPMIPRIMSEHAHSLTGIDIHPGATIGPGFFIDHGTGVVVGETCTIGRNVKLYQGVTLGALSFEKDADGRLVKGVKRHPDVGDHVVIYAGATILGGETAIGENSVIGGNVWLTHSVPPGSRVVNQQPNPLIRRKDGTWEMQEGTWTDPGAGI